MHVVVIGGGGVGRHVAQEFSRFSDVVLIDRNPDVLENIENELDVMLLQGDGTHRSALRKAEVARATIVVAATRNDATNLAAGALAVELGAQRAVARVDDSAFYEVPAPLGVERNVLGVDAICASRLVGTELLRQVTALDASTAATFLSGTFLVASVKVAQDAAYAGQSVDRLASEGAVVGGIVRRGRLFSAADAKRLEHGDTVIIGGSPIIASRRVRMLCQHAAGTAVVVGGGEVGEHLARDLGSLERRVKIIDNDRARCEELAKSLPNATIVHGDGTQLAFLQDEQVGSADLVLAATHSDEVNLMACLLSRQLGVYHTFALVQQPSYVPVYDHLGVSGSTSGHEVLAAAVRRLLPGRTLVASQPLGVIPSQIVEVRIPAKLDRSLRLADIAFPVDTRVLGSWTPRDGQFRAGRRTQLTGGEHVLLICRDSGLRQLEKTLQRLAPASGAMSRLRRGLLGNDNKPEDNEEGSQR